MPRTLLESLDNLYTTTWQNMKDDVADQIFDGSPFWFWMRSNDRLESVEGGRWLEEPVRYAKSDTVQFIGRGEAVPLSDREFLTAAKDDWRYMVDSILRFGVDDQQNRGRNQIISLMNAKLENARDSMTDQLEASLCGLQTGKSFNGLRNLVADDPASGTLHGIDRSVETWWRNQRINGSDGVVNGGAAANTVFYNTDPNMVLNVLMNLCSRNLRQDSPDIIVSALGPYETYWNFCVDALRITNKTMADKGFQSVEFRGVPWVWTPQIPNAAARRVYMLNTKFLRFKYDTSMYFDMTEWKAIPAQVNDRAAQIVLAGNLMTSRPRVHGVIHSIPVPPAA